MDDAEGRVESESVRALRSLRIAVDCRRALLKRAFCSQLVRMSLLHDMPGYGPLC